MRAQPTAFAWIDPDSETPAWHRAQVQRLARHLGYMLLWPTASLIPLVDQVRASDVDCLITPSPEHLSPLELNSIMAVCPVESASPRLSFSKWIAVDAGRAQ
ncbi:hypothetical protein KO481_21430 [Nocardia sp. NEAU-G5]|uniref:Uncharacterized protein n=1 Tax=Nocardia albiluteola TaxID=2842303 RepID=A0ABS6B2U6_9NOCA|nr:hypothetical protein [Nocardia albiluteola]